MLKQMLFLAFLAGSASAQTSGIAGIWQGTLEVGQVKLRVAFHITASNTGALTATFDSLDQNALAIPCESVAFADNKLHVEIPSAHAKYDGMLNGNEITGTFTQGVALPLRLKRADKIETAARAKGGTSDSTAAGGRLLARTH